MYVRRALALVALVAVPLASCGDDDAPAADQSAPASGATASTDAPRSAGTDATTSTSSGTAPTTTVDLAVALAGRTFLSIEVTGYELVAGTQIELTFEGSNVAASGGCNRLVSGWSLEGDVLVVAEMAMTQMACEPAALMDQDTWLAALLTSRPTVFVDGDELTLTATDGTVVTFLDREVANPDLALEGTTWSVEGLVSDDAVSSVATGGRVPTVRLQGGTVNVDTGCNTGTGTYEIAGSDITFGAIATTRMACIDAAASSAETTVLATLTGTATAEIEADVLRLTNGTSGLVLGAAPDGGAAPAGLEGVPWPLDSTVAGSTTTAIAAGVRQPTLLFDAGRLTVDTGCNTGSGTYTLAGDQVTFGPIAMTLILCEGVTNDVERAILAVLTATATAAIGDGVLTLTDGDRGLHYTAS